APLPTWHALPRLWSLLAAGRDAEYRRGVAGVVRRGGRPRSGGGSGAPARGGVLPPRKNPGRAPRWKPPEPTVGKDPGHAKAHHWLGNAYFRAARFAEAERALRRAIELSDEPGFRLLLASTCHRLGNQDEARAHLQKAEERYAAWVQKALQAEPY